MRMQRARAWAALALVGVVVLGGCTTDASGAPPPAPTPSQTPTETAQERQERLDYEAAEKSYRTFRAEYNRVLRNGGARHATLVMRRTAGGDYLREFEEVVEAYQGLGVRQVGDERVVYVRRGPYSPQELILEVCEDSRQVKALNAPKGTPSLSEVRTATLQVRPVEGEWKVWAGRGKKVDSCG